MAVKLDARLDSILLKLVLSTELAAVWSDALRARNRGIISEEEYSSFCHVNVLYPAVKGSVHNFCVASGIGKQMEEYFAGYLRNIHVDPTELEAGEIEAHYNGLIGYLPFI